MDKPLLFPKRESKLSNTPQFILTKKIPIKVLRKAPGEFVKGRWVEGKPFIVDLEANVQPMRGHELQSMPESDRTKYIIKVYSVEALQTVKEEDSTTEDLIYYDGKLFSAVRTLTYKMGVLNHTKTIAIELPRTPDDYKELLVYILEQENINDPIF